MPDGITGRSPALGIVNKNHGDGRNVLFEGMMAEQGASPPDVNGAGATDSETCERSGEWKRTTRYGPLWSRNVAGRTCAGMGACGVGGRYYTQNSGARTRDGQIREPRRAEPDATAAQPVGARAVGQ